MGSLRTENCLFFQENRSVFDVFEGYRTPEGAKIAPKIDFGGLETSFGATWGFIGHTLGEI